MSRYAVCDICGSKDDWSVGDKPFQNGGALIQFRDDDGSDDFVAEAEICPACRTKLLEAFPAMRSVLRGVTNEGGPE